MSIMYICMDLGMWQLYQEHNYNYLSFYYSFRREAYRISVLILFKLLSGYISSVFLENHQLTWIYIAVKYEGL